MENNKLNEGLESLNRIKLLMSYKNDMTLTENEENLNKQPINEIAPVVILGVELGLPWLIGAGATALAGAGIWINKSLGGGNSFENTKNFFDGFCKTTDTKPTIDKTAIRAAAEKIFNAIVGWGTDLDDIKNALSEMPTVGDLCELNKWYGQQYGNLYEDLDGDIDGTDFVKYVWSVINPKIVDASEAIENAKAGKTKFKDFITKNYPDAKVSDQDITINDNIYTIKQNGNEWDFKLEGDTFIYQQ